MIRPVLVAACAALAATGTAAPSAGLGADTTMTSTPSAAQPAATPAEVGGITFPQVPAGLGAFSAFDSEDDDVQITTGVWESTHDQGSAVDLSVTVVRSEKFATPQALRDWIVPWQERPAEQAPTEPTTVQGQPAWQGPDQIVWLIAPGVGVSATVDAARFDAGALHPLAEAAHETPAGGAAAPK